MYMHIIVVGSYQLSIKILKLITKNILNYKRKYYYNLFPMKFTVTKNTTFSSLFLDALKLQKQFKIFSYLLPDLFYLFLQIFSENPVWQNSQNMINDIEIDNFLNSLKQEQLKSVRNGDFLWDFSFLFDNFGKESGSINNSVKSSRQLCLIGKPKFVCVIKNSRFSIKNNNSLKNYDDVTELHVFDGVKVRNQVFYKSD